MTKELMKRGHRSLVLWEHGTLSEFVVCSYYDPAKEEGSQWCWGHYFGDDLNAAVRYINEADGDTYYEIVWISPDGETTVDTAWSLGDAQNIADDMKSVYPDRTYKVIAYECAGYVYEGGMK